MKKSIVTIVSIIVLGAAAFAVAMFLTKLQSSNSGETNSQHQQAEGQTEKSEPGVIQEESGPKPDLSEKAGNIDDSNLSPEQQQRRDAKQDQ